MSTTDFYAEISVHSTALIHTFAVLSFHGQSLI